MSKEHERSFRFRLRTLFLLVLIASLLMAAAIPVIRHRSKVARQVQVAKKVEELGGKVGFSFGFLEDRGFLDSVWYATFAPSAIEAVSTVELRGANISNDDLIVLREMPGLEVLDISATSVDDGAIPYLEAATSLRVIDLQDTEISVDAIQRLRNALPDAVIYHRPVQK